MKRVISMIVVTLFLGGIALAAENPIDKGSWVLDGMAYFTNYSGDAYENGDGDAITEITIMPDLMYFVAPSIAIGLMANYTNQSQGDFSDTQFGIGPSIGYYFNLDKGRAEATGAVYPYIKGFFQYTDITFDDGEEESGGTITSFGGMGGVLFMLSDAVALNGNVMFRSDSFDGDDSDESVSGTVIRVGVGVTAFIW